MTSAHGADGCAICAMVKAEPEGGFAYEDESWVAGVLDGLEIPGWLVLALRRHAVETTPLTEAEAAQLGVAIRLLSAGITEATGAERVYLQAYGEVERHWHMLVSARTPEIPPEHRHIGYFANRHRYVDQDRAVGIARQVRGLLNPQDGLAEAPAPRSRTL